MQAGVTCRDANVVCQNRDLCIFRIGTMRRVVATAHVGCYAGKVRNDRIGRENDGYGVIFGCVAVLPVWCIRLLLGDLIFQ